MTALLIRGIRHLRKYGFLLTLIAAVKWFRSRYEPAYYEQKVSDRAKSVGSDLSVNGPTSVTEETILGDNVNFNSMEIRGGGKVTIGDNFHSGPGCLILTRNHNYDQGDAVPYDDTYIYKEVNIEDNVWIGARVTIIPGVTIKEGAIIQANSTVTDDIPKGAIAGGSPAKVIGKRDMEHYERLKRENKFH